ncbi:hypothetical protein A3F06_04475 [candidate division TM6 bacterium RIFCSPHIGHO2_12_FULL_36_22]|nr:MAG: hypothetical protein A3F06_04475 [candidate division TM6 bacterium RIFCSPHIGHO2_12_FULL_36_22]
MKPLYTLLIFTSTIIISGCIPQRGTDQSKQLDARQMYDNARYEYERELVLFRELQHAQGDAAITLDKKIKDEVLLKNEQYNDEHQKQWFGKRWLQSNKHENYPFIQYKKHLDSYIQQLEDARDKLYWKSEGVGYLIIQLIKELEQIRRYIITSNSYQREHHMIEQQKLQAKIEYQEKKNNKKDQKKK